MSIWLILTIICILGIIPAIVWGIKVEWDNLFGIGLTFILGACIIVFSIVSIVQPISIKKELLRQNKERQQILYQIENLEEDSDRVKLNEWILTYNDWVNDVNTSKELYGFASWYYKVDMSKHTIIDLV